MAADQDSFSKGFDSTSNLGAEGSMARQAAPLPPGSTRMASTTGVPKAPLTPAKPKPATVTIRERPQPPPASAQVTIKERPQPPPGPAKVTIRERPRPQAKSSQPPIKSPPPQRQRPATAAPSGPLLIDEIRAELRRAGLRDNFDEPDQPTTPQPGQPGGPLTKESLAEIDRQLKAQEREDKRHPHPGGPFSPEMARFNKKIRDSYAAEKKANAARRGKR